MQSEIPVHMVIVLFELDDKASVSSLKKPIASTGTELNRILTGLWQ